MKKTVQNQEHLEWHSHLGTATESSVVMSPSCPSLPAPQENSWPRSLRARLWASPHATCTMCWSANAPICSERDQNRGEMHRLETEMLLPPLAAFTVWPTPNQDGMLICFSSQLRGPGASGRKEQTAVSPQTPGKRACNAGTYPLVPESRTPAYRMVSPTCRVFHPQLIKTQRHPQNIPRCLSPRWSDT